MVNKFEILQDQISHADNLHQGLKSFRAGRRLRNHVVPQFSFSVSNYKTNIFSWVKKILIGTEKYKIKGKKLQVLPTNCSHSVEVSPYASFQKLCVRVCAHVCMYMSVIKLKIKIFTFKR